MVLWMLSLKAEKVNDAIVEIVQPVVDWAVFGNCFRRLHRHVLLTTDAEVASNRTTAHWASLQLVKAAGANTRMSKNKSIHYFELNYNVKSK